MEAKKVKFDTSLWQKSIKDKIENREKLRISKLEKAVKILKQYSNEISVENLYIFGSITRPQMFTEYSDVDIAVKNIEKNISFFQIWKQIEDICDFDIDLMDMDECNFAHLIEKNAIKIK